MDIIQTSAVDIFTRAARKASTWAGITLLVAAFVAPLLALPVIAVSSFPEMVQLMNAAGSSSSALLLNMVVGMSILGFVSSLLSIAYAITQSRSEEAHNALPLKTLIFQNFCLLVSCSFLFLR